LVSSLCIRSSISMSCCSSSPWPLLLFADYVFVLNKSFILYKFALMDDL
jgi:hypothetical protein